MILKKPNHPFRNTAITVSQYTNEFGSKHDARWTLSRPQPRARCPICKRELSLIGWDRPTHDQHFSHMGKDKEVWCPLKNMANFKYALLLDRNPNIERGKLIRANFFKNWQIHHQRMFEMIGPFDIFKDFIDLIDFADSESLWTRGSLMEWEIPYIFMAWKTFPPVKNNKTGQWIRGSWVRFWFDHQIRTIDDLWIRTQGKRYISKASYKPKPRGGTPGPEDLLEVVSFEINADFLKEGATQPNAFKVQCMRDHFPKELAQ